MKYIELQLEISEEPLEDLPEEPSEKDKKEIVTDLLDDFDITKEFLI